VAVHIANALSSMSMVGLPETTVKENKERVRALLSTHFEFPARRITINLAPADLPIELGILAASEQIPQDRLRKHEFIGELALTGEPRSIRDALPVALQSRAAGRALRLPAVNANEAALVRDATVFGATHLMADSEYPHGGTRSPRAPTPRRRRKQPTTSAIWPTCAACITPSAPWRSPQRAGTTCGYSDRPTRAKPCLPAVYLPSCPP
jgi:magnesium chelatase family protein